MINDFKLDSYHNPTLFIDDDKMFVPGSEDQSLHVLQKQNLEVIWCYMYDKASSMKLMKTQVPSCSWLWQIHIPSSCGNVIVYSMNPLFGRLLAFSLLYFRLNFIPMLSKSSKHITSSLRYTQHNRLIALWCSIHTRTSVFLIMCPSFSIQYFS